MKKSRTTRLMPLAACLALSTVGHADPTSPALCSSGIAVPLEGTMQNTLDPLDGSTVGVLQLKLGGRASKFPTRKLTCGIVGQNAGAVFPASYYINTLSCDDAVRIPTSGSPALKTHSRITLDTVGGLTSFQFCNGTDPSAGVAGTIHEIATPKSLFGTSSGRGIFAGVVEGQVEINAKLNCAGSTAETFKGYVCLNLPLESDDD